MLLMFAPYLHLKARTRFLLDERGGIFVIFAFFADESSSVDRVISSCADLAKDGCLFVHSLKWSKTLTRIKAALERQRSKTTIEWLRSLRVNQAWCELFFLSLHASSSASFFLAHIRPSVLVLQWQRRTMPFATRSEVREACDNSLSISRAPLSMSAERSSWLRATYSLLVRGGKRVPIIVAEPN